MRPLEGRLGGIGGQVQYMPCEFFYYEVGELRLRESDLTALGLGRVAHTRGLDAGCICEHG